MQINVIEYDSDLIARFEESIDPLNPERSRIPAQVVGYGEVSAVLTIKDGDPNLVYKRMPMFEREEELAPYLASYKKYQEQLAAAGIHTVPAAITSVTPKTGNIVVYIVQEKLNDRSLVNKAIQILPQGQVEHIFETILEYLRCVIAYNKEHAGKIELGIDAQMSNWAIAGFDPQQDSLPDPLKLIYIDTSTPLMRLDGEEQLDLNLFLRSTPSFLRGIIRLLYLEDVLNRYYDIRQVVVDILANLYKEKREDVIPDLLGKANSFLAESARNTRFQPLTEEEIAAYYREDARIWRFSLAARRADRQLHRLLGKPYPYVLPGHIDR